MNVAERMGRLGTESAFEVLARAKVTHDGVWAYRGYEVTYRSGVVRHRAVLPATLTVCAPRSQFPDGCEPVE